VIYSAHAQSNAINFRHVSPRHWTVYGDIKSNLQILALSVTSCLDTWTLRRFRGHMLACLDSYTARLGSYLKPGRPSFVPFTAPFVIELITYVWVTVCERSFYPNIMIQIGARDSVVAKSTVLQEGRTRVRDSMTWVIFFKFTQSFRPH
jgi:hypothetical protein